jgi:hypothetical protein
MAKKRNKNKNTIKLHRINRKSTNEDSDIQLHR